jgi:hypothetical protein
MYYQIRSFLQLIILLLIIIIHKIVNYHNHQNSKMHFLDVLFFFVLFKVNAINLLINFIL